MDDLEPCLKISNWDVITFTYLYVIFLLRKKNYNNLKKFLKNIQSNSNFCFCFMKLKTWHGELIGAPLLLHLNVLNTYSYLLKTIPTFWIACIISFFFNNNRGLKLFLKMFVNIRYDVLMYQWSVYNKFVHV